MTFASLPDDVREIAIRELTEKQLEAFIYECSGLGVQRIARMVGVTKGAIVGRLDGAHLKLGKAGVRQDEFGRWSVEEEVAA
jgi:hypothetical protein